MNTRLKQTPLPTPLSSVTNSISDDITYTSGDTSSLPTFVSRGLQTDLEPQPVNPSSTQIRYYEKQPSQVSRLFHILFYFYDHFLLIDSSYISIFK
jgi:hypothetical protein